MINHGGWIWTWVFLTPCPLSFPLQYKHSGSNSAFMNIMFHRVCRDLVSRHGSRKTDTPGHRTANLTICFRSLTPIFAPWVPWILVPHSAQLLIWCKALKSHGCHGQKSCITPKLTHLPSVPTLPQKSLKQSLQDTCLATPHSDPWFHDPHFYRTLPSLVLITKSRVLKSQGDCNTPISATNLHLNG